MGSLPYLFIPTTNALFLDPLGKTPHHTSIVIVLCHRAVGVNLSVSIIY
jgi:hypothetical protein